MDFVNQAVAQLRELFLSMTVGARIVAGLLLAVVIVSMGFLFHKGTAGPDEFLFGGERLPDSDLNKLEAAIAAANLTGHVREGGRIRVPAERKAEFMGAIANGDALPRNFHDLLEKAMDKGGVWESREMTRQRSRIARAQTLSEIFRAMPWVDDAVVIYDEQQSGGLNSVKQVVASVNVMPIVGESLTHERKKRLQKAAAGAVFGLKPENIAVTNLGDDTSFASDSFSPEAFENDYLRERARFNEYQRKAIYEVVSYIPGVRVQVNTEMDNTVEDVTQSVKPGEKPQALFEEITNHSTERTSTDPGGRPGLDAQGPYRQDNLAQTSNSDKEKSKKEMTENFVGYSNQRIRQAGYQPQNVSAAIAVPRQHLVDIWRRRNPTPPGQAPREPEEADLEAIAGKEEEKIENLVEPLLAGHVLGEDSYKYVTVEFVDTAIPQPIPEPELATTALAWTGRNWGRLSMVLLAVFGLLMLRSIATFHSPTPQDNSPTLVLDSDEEQATEESEDDGEARDRLRLKKGPSLKEDLVEIVREDPDAAASILRNWISKAA